MLRNLMLRAASSSTMVRLFATLGSRSGLADRFVAGITLESAIEVVKNLNFQEIFASLDQLGEGVTVRREAERATDGYIRVLGKIAESGVRSNISIKLTQLGLDIDTDLCRKNLGRILEKAQSSNNFVRVDMESSRHTQGTLDLFEEALAAHGPERVGIVIQSYLHRSEADVRRLAGLGCNIRLCKGAYKEPPEIAYQKKRIVDSNLKKLIKISLDTNRYTAIATHDHRVIDFTCRHVEENGIPGDRYEFQMLYGVRRDYQLQLRARGYRMRVYVPFGTQWAPYFMRRLAERPANLLFVTRAIFRD